MKNFVVFLLAIIMIFTPYGLNLNKADAQDDSNPSCGNGAAYSQSPEDYKILKKGKTLDQIQNKVKDSYKVGASIYGKQHFKWNETAIIKYTDENSNILVPLKTNTKMEKEFLVIGYQHQTQQIGQVVVMELKAKDMTHSKMTLKTLSGEELVGLKIDGDTAHKEIYADKTSSIFQPNTAHAGYWGDVKDCILDLWSDLPSWLKWTCSSACGGFLFGGNLFAGSACAGCLAGWAVSCLAWPNG